MSWCLNAPGVMHWVAQALVLMLVYNPCCCLQVFWCRHCHNQIKDDTEQVGLGVMGALVCSSPVHAHGGCAVGGSIHRSRHRCSWMCVTPACIIVLVFRSEASYAAAVVVNTACLHAAAVVATEWPWTLVELTLEGCCSYLATCCCAA